MYSLNILFFDVAVPFGRGRLWLSTIFYPLLGKLTFVSLPIFQLRHPFTKSGLVGDPQPSLDPFVLDMVCESRFQGSQFLLGVQVILTLSDFMYKFLLCFHFTLRILRYLHLIRFTLFYDECAEVL